MESMTQIRPTAQPSPFGMSVNASGATVLGFVGLGNATSPSFATGDVRQGRTTGDLADGAKRTYAHWGSSSWRPSGC